MCSQATLHLTPIKELAPYLRFAQVSWQVFLPMPNCEAGKLTYLQWLVYYSLRDLATLEYWALLALEMSDILN